MKFFMLLFLFAGLNAHAQKSIKLDEAVAHVGDSITVTGKVFSTRYFENSKDAPTLMNLGAAYPNQLLTVVIYGESRSKFSQSPEVFYKNKNITVSGRVELYKNQPQIVVRDASQLSVQQAN